ncbi:MAG: hypothetical protein N3A38_14395 [Planctomycetota bacterium]|nr:hypothetical protein [Planctomycetota bacterium]
MREFIARAFLGRSRPVRGGVGAAVPPTGRTEALPGGVAEVQTAGPQEAVHTGSVTVASPAAPPATSDRRGPASDPAMPPRRSGGGLAPGAGGSAKEKDSDPEMTPAEGLPEAGPGLVARGGAGGAVQKAEFEFRFDPSDPVFDGHFPGRPILPGVFQIEMARFCAEAMLGRQLDILRVEKAKFSRAVSPGQVVRVRVETGAGEGKPPADGDRFPARAFLSVGGDRVGEVSLLVGRRGPGDRSGGSEAERAGPVGPCGSDAS